MTINKDVNGKALTISLEGRLDTTTAPGLEEEINGSLENIEELTFDFAKLEYISSAGLRVLLSAQKKMNKQGKMVVKNVSEEVSEIFEVTGFQISLLSNDYNGRYGKGHMKKLEIEADVNQLNDVMAFIEETLDEAGAAPKTAMQVNLAVEEIFVNIAHYAYAPGKGNAAILVNVDKEAGELSVQFRDTGVPYNPLEKEDPDLTIPVAERQIGGLGIFMTKKVMDDVIYEHKDGQNILTLKKKL
ncbi:anti-sigma factor antagonist [Butyrivibrio sp. WCD3002]|uniref:anti-sigma factor antagonist n=1 Tax=Butyrivibrio sp. WCD3002 TaxID=1280676 RepID=UPI00040ABE7C|nr:anti-sigma factor antagonist [Butyrivibrio sp. WCD3002]